MFGRHRLTHDGTATVVSCDAITSGLRSAEGSGFNFSSDRSLNYDLILDVTPEGASTFRAEASHRFGVQHTPKVGDSLKVRCNPEHKTVEIDIAGDARYDPSVYVRAEASAAEAEHERLLNAAPGTPAEPQPTTADIARLVAERRRERDRG